jgi:hypothetical protein
VRSDSSHTKNVSDASHKQIVQHLAGLCCKRELYACVFPSRLSTFDCTEIRTWSQSIKVGGIGLLKSLRHLPDPSLDTRAQTLWSSFKGWRMSALDSTPTPAGVAKNVSHWEVRF